MKLEKDFLGKSGVFDISKVPDIYDCVKYDLQHNREVLVSGHAEELYMYAKNMADVSYGVAVDCRLGHRSSLLCFYLFQVVIPQEYGMNMIDEDELMTTEGIGGLPVLWFSTS